MNTKTEQATMIIASARMHEMCNCWCGKWEYDISTWIM